MATYRIHKTKDYTVMSNAHLRDKELSLKTKGLLSLMLSLPADWNYSIMGLETLSKDGKDSVMTALIELEKFGYLTRTKKLNDKGQFDGYIYDIYEKPNTEKPYAEKPNTEKPPQINTNKQSTNKQNTKEEKKVRKTGSFDTIISNFTTDPKTTELLQEWLKVRKAKRAAMTDRAIQLNLNKLELLAKQSNMSVNTYLEEVICRGWAAFYEIKNYSNNKSAAAIQNINGKEYEIRNGKYYIPNGSGVAVNPFEKDDLPF